MIMTNLIGTGDDLEIYHNGSASFIHDNTGDLNLYMESGSKIVVKVAQVVVTVA